ncbi:hypothetical protein ZIOFF_060514 [Zingiber officinale]|uniref:Uncharacterized protein n=1 Tax=Zingiber officinale TaxID=94328 RepID=A0A8J5KL46_ZINOF|nr:hypothetical protein ZIOFF_060514 [Zingiber officinale]
MPITTEQCDHDQHCRPRAYLAWWLSSVDREVTTEAVLAEQCCHNCSAATLLSRGPTLPAAVDFARSWPAHAKQCWQRPALAKQFTLLREAHRHRGVAEEGLPAVEAKSVLGERALAKTTMKASMEEMDIMVVVVVEQVRKGLPRTRKKQSKGGICGGNSEIGGLVKILKKYDKRTRALIKQPFIEKVLQQPFFTTDLLYKLVKECVAMLDHLFPSNNLSISAECDGQNGVPKPAQSGGRVPELKEIKYMQSLYMKSTVAALRSLKHIRSKSSTIKTD